MNDFPKNNKSWIKRIALPLPENHKTGWQPYPLYSDETAVMDFMGCHISVLSSGVSPHKPHKHIEEELLILLDGKAELVIVAENNCETVEPITPWNFAYYPAWHKHTIRNTSDKPITYLMFKWCNGMSQGLKRTLPAAVHRPVLNSDESDHIRKGFKPVLQFEGPTKYLHHLQCHVSFLAPGAGYPPHPDPYDVAIVLLSGEVRTLDQDVSENSVIFYAANEPHGIKNIGTSTAKYLVFEFHGRDTLTLTQKLMRKILKHPKRALRRLLSIIYS